MSEYEITNLALQRAAITAGYWQTGISLAVWSGLVLYGCRIMRRGTEQCRAEKTKQHTETMTVAEQRHTEAMKASEERHIEAMKALQELIERTAPPK